jgi:hypothetical protein
MVMQSAEDRQRQNASDGLNGSERGCILGERQVRSDTVLILRVRAEHMTKMPLAEHDHMIKAFASDRADQS